MGNRILKESIRTSKSINSMTDFQFRMWAYLVTYVDDYGRGSADPELLKGFVFPRRKGVTESTIEKTLAELATIGSIHLYEVDGESYLCFPNWGDHQRIQQKRSKFPPPPAENNGSNKSTVSHGELPPESNPNTNTNPNTNPEPEHECARGAAGDVQPDFNTVEVYLANNITGLNATLMQEFQSFKDDLPEELIRHAIDEACAQNVRSYSYVRKILNRYVDKGFKSLGDVLADKAVFERNKQAKTAPIQQPKFNYQQHSYTEADYQDIFYDPTKDYGGKA